MDGILLVDKPAGWTSHDVVAKVRSLLRQQDKSLKIKDQSQGKMSSASHLDAVQGSQEERAKRTSGTESERQTPADTAMRQKPAGMSGSAGQQGWAVRRLKVGHTGTLDPFATGLLVLVVGSYTKRAQEFSGLDKTYEAEMVLGATSTTGDKEGEIIQIPHTNYHIPSRSDIEAVLSSFMGQISQTPHKYSAVKVNGQRAYKLARQGKEVQLEPRQVTVYRLQIAGYKYPKLQITARVSSGTYIRSLAEDIGKKLGTGAYLSSLRRTSVGKFNVKQATNIDTIN